MSEVHINWSKSIEPQNKAEIEKYLNPFLWLVPKWCQTINISLYSADGDAAISTLINFDYRKINVDFYSCWLTQTDEKKQCDIIHECVHFFVNELYHQARRIVIATCKQNEELKSYAFEELDKTVEGITQDLAYAIAEKFND